MKLLKLKFKFKDIHPYNSQMNVWNIDHLCVSYAWVCFLCDNYYVVQHQQYFNVVCGVVGPKETNLISGVFI